MLAPLQKFEETLARFEARLLTVVVLVMLGLAVYNVLYRNVLVPIQVKADRAVNSDVPDPVLGKEGTKATSKTESQTNNFGGGFGDETEDETDESDESFGGGFGDEPTPKKTEKKPKSDEGFGGGFGGGFDDQFDDNDVGVSTKNDASSTGFGGGFGGASDDPPEEPISDDFVYVPPKQSSIGAFIQAIKLEWIDVLLRHLVLLIGFLGAMLATRRRKHITVDALSKILRGRLLIGTTLATTLLSIVICLLLGIAGMDLVELGLQYPKELATWVDEWQMQLIFPIGFFMLAFHFSVRAFEETVAFKNDDDSIMRSEPVQVALSGPDEVGEEE